MISLVWGGAWGLVFLKSSPVDANVQPELRTAALEFELLKESLVLI